MPEDPYAQFGGSITEDPYAKFGGSVLKDPSAADLDKAGIRRAGTPQPDGPNAGKRVLDYTTDMLSNIPRSALNLAKNIGSAAIHPVDTAGNLAKVVTGTAQNMTPGYVTPDRPGYSKEANAAGAALKQRYGSLDAAAESLRTDPVGVAADVAAVAGGVSGIARGGAAVASRFPRVASGLSKAADVSSAVSDAVNPVNLITKPVGYVAKATGKGLIKSALGLSGRTERYGATPATAALENTSGITPGAIKASATAKLADLDSQLQGLIKANPTATPSLDPAIQVIMDDITKIKAANGVADDLTPMYQQLTEARSGFQGDLTPTGGVASRQPGGVFHGMKRQFGDDFTKFDAAIPLKNSTRVTGNKAYHELSSEFNKTYPGAKPINQEMQSLIPVRDAAARTDEHAGVVQQTVDRATRPTGGLAATIAGAMVGGPAGAGTVVALQSALSSPTVKAALARLMYGAGKGMKSPLTSRTLNAMGVASEAMPKYSRGGIIRRPTLLVDAKTRKPTGLMGESGAEAIVPLPPKLATPGGKSERHLINSMRFRLDAQIKRGIRPPRLETPKS